MSISVCTVILDSNVGALKVFLDSLKRTATQIEEVIVTNISDTELKYKPPVFNFPVRFLRVNNFTHRHKYGHSLGLLTALQESKGEYVLFSDNDIYFYVNRFTELYLRLYREHGLSFLGIKHYRDNQSFGEFPIPTNLFFKKDVFPPSTFLQQEIAVLNTKEHLELPECKAGHFLFPLKINQYVDQFPKPVGPFDFGPGGNLHLWCKWKRLRWLSFDTIRGHPSHGVTYDTSFTSNSHKVRAPNNPKTLLYHRCRFYGKQESRLHNFIRQYKRHVLECGNDVETLDFE
jgi:glycosyltransferase involved in cell wall biosynthesis